MDFSEDFVMSPMTMKRSDSLPSSIDLYQHQEIDTISTKSLGITEKMQKLEILSYQQVQEKYKSENSDGRSLYSSIQDFSRDYLENRVDFSVQFEMGVDFENELLNSLI